MRPLIATSLLVCGSLAFSQSPNREELTQPYRPQYHFSPVKNWTNDPNGLVYFAGEYHLFYQYNPFGDKWGHMSWGHAVSKDLLRWEELPVAIPEGDGVMIFTGSAVPDEHNTSGFCTGGKPCLVAIYTGHTPEHGSTPALQTQNLAYSNDSGRTWTKFSGNPVLNLHMSDFRDPKVFWSEQSHEWIMAVSLPNDHKVRLYGAPDLKTWKELSDFGPAGATTGQWECPDLFEATVDNGPQKRWVLKVGLNPGALQGGSGEQYFIGQFDGTKFTNENPPATTLWTDYGKDCYCALTFNGLPSAEKPVMLGWMDNWQYAGDLPTHPWRGQMTIPRSVSLTITPEGIRLSQEPVPLLAKLRDKNVSVIASEIGQVNLALTRSKFALTNTFELDSATMLGTAQEFGWRVLASSGTATVIGYDRESRKVFVDRTHSGDTSFSKDFAARTETTIPKPFEVLRLRILVDRNSVEVFANGGLVAMTNLVFPPDGANGLEAYEKGGRTAKISVQGWQIRSVY